MDSMRYRHRENKTTTTSTKQQRNLGRIRGRTAGIEAKDNLLRKEDLNKHLNERRPARRREGGVKKQNRFSN